MVYLLCPLFLGCLKFLFFKLVCSFLVVWSCVLQVLSRLVITSGGVQVVTSFFFWKNIRFFHKLFVEVNAHGICRYKTELWKDTMFDEDFCWNICNKVSDVKVTAVIIIGSFAFVRKTVFFRNVMECRYSLVVRPCAVNTNGKCGCAAFHAMIVSTYIFGNNCDVFKHVVCSFLVVWSCVLQVPSRLVTTSDRVMCKKKMSHDTNHSIV